MKKIACFMFLVLFTAMVYAQDNSFLLYNFKCNVSVIENKTETKAKIGKILSSADQLKLADGSIATLICNEVSMFTISKAGTYMLSKLKDSCIVKSSSFTANYIKYVWNQMTSHEEGSPGSNRKMFMNTVGAVSRSVNNIWIDPRLDTVNYSSGEFPLSWKSYADANEFEFLLYSPANIGTPLYKTLVTKMKISIPVFLDKMKPGNTYFWTTAVKGEQNDELKVLNYVSPEVFAELLNKFKSQGGAYEAPAEQSYRLAFMLEDAHYLAEAYQYYLKAATTDADNPLYRSTLMSFKKDYEIK
jgi:hypothetical protein